ncbi:MAG: RtcB family protein [Bacillota bacterium]
MKYYNFPAEKDRNCDIRLFASKEVYQSIEKTALGQLFNASRLPGVVGVVGLPDLHQGYGLPIGGVMAVEIERGIISPGAVGFDINCGVRLLTTGLTLPEVRENFDKLMKKIMAGIPSGLGSKSSNDLNKNLLKKIVSQGIPFLIREQGWGALEDVTACENQGVLEAADPGSVPEQAWKRGSQQLGTLGSGNHFLELQRVDRVYRENTGLQEGQLTFMIHTGSRGFGHEIADNYMKQAKNSGIKTPSKNLACFYINSEEGQHYYRAMTAAANYAFANRQLITHRLRQIVKGFYSIESLPLYYDLTHNIARKEQHQGQKLLLHRKGATRLAPGGIALIPGSMGTYSYLVVSSDSEATRLSYNSVAHGAGRRLGRRQAKREITAHSHQQSLGEVRVYQGGRGNLLDESPLAYKDIDLIIASLKKTGLARPLARFQPLAVLKG